MADYDLRCLNCGHGPHGIPGIQKGCANCPCPKFIRADFVIAGTLLDMQAALNGLVDLLCEAFPEAYDSLMAKRKAQIEKEQKDGSTPTPDSDSGSGSSTTPTADSPSTDTGSTEAETSPGDSTEAST